MCKGCILLIISELEMIKSLIYNKAMRNLYAIGRKIPEHMQASRKSL